MSRAESPTRYRYWVMAVLCSLAFLTYLDRICIMRVQGDIGRDLEFARLTEADEQSLSERGLENRCGGAGQARPGSGDRAHELGVLRFRRRLRAV